ncbi:MULTISPECIES: MazG family protein [unclassified Crossiella]|uniref:MazG family protein n=1 Tax=unclassified Crossiella TaxID=2620835 RepID=UPI001FFEC233|nr:MULTISPECIES: MazG family protein [unclassified Crossiella]MCK2237038.1 MazG family protein [Crossiella sp. S99.2]MCK2250706.1 MazG family protein [Crossiella sp. S99.1]
MTPVFQGCAVVLLSERLGAVLPLAAVPVVRTAAEVYADPAELGFPAPPPAAELLALAAEAPLVLLTLDAEGPAAAALVRAGAKLIGTPEPRGAGLVEAAQVMHRLRSPGGCPWDAEQTHDSLRQYLVEETYELLEAIEDGDRAALREELGDVLLQVLFHARVAEEDGADPFSIDEVATELVAKLVGRHPHVFAEHGDPAVRDSHTQQQRWEELKQMEKRRESAVDGVALGQPAVALAAKLAQRAGRAGVPVDLLPDGGDPGRALFAVAARAKLDGGDPESALRAVARGFGRTLRAAEVAARADGADPAALDADGWRRYWPTEQLNGGSRGDSSTG